MLTLAFAFLLSLLALPAHAGPWSEREIDPKVLTDVTAYTVHKKQWHMGIMEQDYGLLKNASVGTSLPYFFVGAANAHAKVTAIQTPKFDAALTAGWYKADLTPFGIPGTLTLTPVGWRGSWLAHRKASVHLGNDWLIAKLDGGLTARQMADAIAAGTGADAGAALLGQLGDQAGVYGGANLTLLQSRFAVDYRLNRRDSIVLAVTSLVWVHGLVAAGISADDGAGTTTEIGASARVSAVLDNVPSATSLSWQMSWKRLHARVGIPIGKDTNLLFVLPQAFSLYWILGPVDKN